MTPRYHQCFCRLKLVPLIRSCVVLLFVKMTIFQTKRILVKKNLADSVSVALKAGENCSNSCWQSQISTALIFDVESVFEAQATMLKIPRASGRLDPKHNAHSLLTTIRHKINCECSLDSLQTWAVIWLTKSGSQYCRNCV
jgi:hypothetical protein